MLSQVTLNHALHLLFCKHQTIFLISSIYMPKGASASAFQLKYSQYSIDFFLSCTLGIIRAKKYLFACYNKIISSRIFLKGYRLIMGLQSDKSTETSNDQQ